MQWIHSCVYLRINEMEVSKEGYEVSSTSGILLAYPKLFINAIEQLILAETPTSY